MFSLVITIIAIALVALLALASVFYGTTAYQKSQDTAKAAQLANQGEQILGAMELFRVDNGKFPNSLDELVPKYLETKPVYANAGKPALDLIPSAYAAAAGAEWIMPVPGRAAAWVASGVSTGPCQAVNQLARGDDGILSQAYSTLKTQCYGPAASSLTVLVTKDPGIFAVLPPGSVDTGTPPATTDTGNSKWFVPPGSKVANAGNGGGTPPTPPTSAPSTPATPPGAAASQYACNVLFSTLTTDGASVLGFNSISVTGPNASKLFARGTSSVDGVVLNNYSFDSNGNTYTGFFANSNDAASSFVDAFPAHAVGTAKVTVTGSGGSSATCDVSYVTQAPAEQTLQVTMTPNSVSPDGTTLVTFTATLGEFKKVAGHYPVVHMTSTMGTTTIAMDEKNVVSMTPSTFVVRAPAAALAGADAFNTLTYVMIGNFGDQTPAQGVAYMDSVTQNPLFFDYAFSAPTVTATPVEVSVNGGTVVTLTVQGIYLPDNLTDYINWPNGSAVEPSFVTRVDSSTVRVRTPAVSAVKDLYLSGKNDFQFMVSSPLSLQSVLSNVVTYVEPPRPANAPNADAVLPSTHSFTGGSMATLVFKNGNFSGANPPTLTSSGQQIPSYDVQVLDAYSLRVVVPPYASSLASSFTVTNSDGTVLTSPSFSYVTPATLSVDRTVLSVTGDQVVSVQGPAADVLGLGAQYVGPFPYGDITERGSNKSVFITNTGETVPPLSVIGDATPIWVFFDGNTRSYYQVLFSSSGNSMNITLPAYGLAGGSIDGRVTYVRSASGVIYQLPAFSYSAPAPLSISSVTPRVKYTNNLATPDFTVKITGSGFQAYGSYTAMDVTLASCYSKGQANYGVRPTVVIDSDTQITLSVMGSDVDNESLAIRTQCNDVVLTRHASNSPTDLYDLPRGFFFVVGAPADPVNSSTLNVLLQGNTYTVSPDASLVGMYGPLTAAYPACHDEGCLLSAYAASYQAQGFAGAFCVRATPAVNSATGATTIYMQCRN